MITNDYKIVYSTDLIGYERSAIILRDALQEAMGVTLPVLADVDSAPADNEILIGHTDRALSARCYANDGAKRLMTYEFVVDGGNIQIACGGPHSAKYAIYALYEALKNGSLASLEVSKTDLTTELVPHTKGTDVRIMSINVLGECYICARHNGKHPVSSERSEILAKLLVDYTPDLVGVQEMDVKFFAPMEQYFKILKQHYGLDYAITLTHHLGKTNDCPIIYRADEYSLDYKNFAPPNYELTDRYSTMFPCGISSTKFTDKRDPSIQIALLSNHWHWEKEDAAPEIPRQQIDADDLAATTKYLEATYPGVRVFSTGDFNSHRFNERYFNRYLEAVDGVAAEQIAISKGVHVPGLIHMGYFIDHVVGRRGTFDVLFHSSTKNHSDILTDHMPIFADIKFI